MLYIHTDCKKHARVLCAVCCCKHAVNTRVLCANSMSHAIRTQHQGSGGANGGWHTREGSKGGWVGGRKAVLGGETGGLLTGCRTQAPSPDH